MTTLVTYSCICDVCGQMVSHETKPIDMELTVPRDPQVFGMDLCASCRKLAAGAVNEILHPIQLATAGRRRS